MVGAMLVGAWLLIHQQCCVTGELESKIRSPLVDPLIRRSALEKNFMRFGRSWTPPQGGTPRDPRAKDNFIRFGRGANMNNGPSEDDYLRRGKSSQSFIRFGRSMENGPFGGDEANDDNPMEKRSKDSFIRFGRSRDGFMRFGRKNEGFMRFGKAKDSFLRFGKGKENFMRFGRTKDGFMRFGRGAGNDASGYIRFGRGKRGPDYGIISRIEPPHGSTAQLNSPCCPSSSSLDPNMIIAPEFSLLPDLNFSPSPPSTRSLMRLG